MTVCACARLFGALALAAWTAAAAPAEIYKWKDEHGRVQFGDRPPSGSTSQKMIIRSLREPQESAAEPDAPKIAGVVMYSTTWCGVCKEARQYMLSRGIPFSEYDVEKTQTGRDAYKKLNGRGVPIILVGGQRMDGFSAPKLERWVQQTGAPRK